MRLVVDIVRLLPEWVPKVVFPAAVSVRRAASCSIDRQNLSPASTEVGTGRGQLLVARRELLILEVGNIGQVSHHLVLYRFSDGRSDNKHNIINIISSADLGVKS